MDDVAFFPDGRSMLIVSHRPFSYFVREVATGEHRSQVIFRYRPATSYAFGPAGRTMFVATRPHPVEEWDLFADAGPWEAKNSDRLWEKLANPNSEAAYAAVRNLLAHPAEAVGFMKARVEVPKPLAADWVAERLKALDAAAFRDREQATSDLVGAGERAIAPLRGAAHCIRRSPRPDSAVLAKVEVQTAEKLRAIRSCEVIEGLGTAEATELLEAWAKGERGTTLVREAKASLGAVEAGRSEIGLGLSRSGRTG